VVNLLEAMLMPQEKSDTWAIPKAKPLPKLTNGSRTIQRIPHENVLADFGLSVADWKKMGWNRDRKKHPDAII